MPQGVLLCDGGVLSRCPAKQGNGWIAKRGILVVGICCLPQHNLQAQEAKSLSEIVPVTEDRR